MLKAVADTTPLHYDRAAAAAVKERHSWPLGLGNQPVKPLLIQHPKPEFKLVEQWSGHFIDTNA